MWPGLCCIAAGLALGALAMAAGRSARRDETRNDLEEAWMTGADRIPPPEVIYVVAGTFRSAQTFIQLTGENPRAFRIVLDPFRLRGITGAKVVMILDWYHGSLFQDFVDCLKIIRADVRYVDLDRMMGVER